MNEMRIAAVTTAKEKPKYRKTAAELLSRCRGFYTDPENEKAFQEWKAQKDAKTVKAVSA